MFITEDEANRRLNSSQNVLTKINKDGASETGVEHTQEPPVVVPDEVLEPEDMTCASAAALGIEYPDSALLRKMLGVRGPGRRIGQTNMPTEVRAATAVCAQLVDTRTAAETFATSYHHADELKHGYTSQQARYGGEDPNAELEKVVGRQMRVVRDLAFEKLTKVLGLMDDDKLKSVSDPVKLARISKDLSGVVDKVLPKEQVNLGGVHFHIMKPEQRTEDSYDVVTVGGQR